MTRLALPLALASSLLLGCGPELIGSTATASSEASTKESGTSGDSEEAGEWLAIGLVLGGALLVATSFTVDSEDFGYLEQHQRDVRVALASGAGPFPSDLAQGLGLPQAAVPHVGEVLRSERERIAPYLEGALDEQRITGFWRELFAVLGADPVTAPGVERVRIRAAELVRR